MEIFNDNFDYQRFQKLLYLVNSKQTLKFSDIETSPSPVWTRERGETLVDIGAYCLMPNHFHLLIKSKDEKDTAMFLQRLLGSHSKYFNTKNDRDGSLFQGKSKAKHITNNEQLKYLFSYIHLNPVKLIQNDWKEIGIKNLEKSKEYLNNYKHSSYLDFIENRPESTILNIKVFPEYFSTPEIFKNEIFEWLSFKDLINNTENKDDNEEKNK